jgi:AraC-like DNA-binding protein
MASPLSKQIEDLMSEKLLFRKIGLNINDVAAELCSNRVYVSRAVNSDFGMTFREYINSKRIEYAEKLLKECPKMSLEDIALDAGFISEQMFVRKFMEIKKFSPSIYVRE